MLQHNIVLLVVTASLFAVGYMYYESRGPSLKTNECDPVVAQVLQKPPSQFSSCESFYLDVGSNIGVQIRKLYEPHRYPGAEMLKVFNDVFGQNRSKVCAIGIEMNPLHTQRLQELEDHYSGKCGYNVKIFKETAAAAQDGYVDFYTDMDAANLEWGASTVYNTKNSAAKQVRAMDISRFFLEEVLPFAQTVVMKLDVEGAETTVLPRLIASGALCRMDTLLIEQHYSGLDKQQAAVLTSTMQLFPSFFTAASCKIQVMNLDDESFLHDADATINTC